MRNSECQSGGDIFKSTELPAFFSTIRGRFFMALPRWFLLRLGLPVKNLRFFLAPGTFLSGLIFQGWCQAGHKEKENFFSEKTLRRNRIPDFREESLSYKKKCTSYCSSAVSWTSSFWLLIFPLQNPFHLHLRIFCDVPTCSNPSDAEVERCGRPVSSVGGVTSWWDVLLDPAKSSPARRAYLEDHPI